MRIKNRQWIVVQICRDNKASICQKLQVSANYQTSWTNNDEIPNTSAALLLHPGRILGQTNDQYSVRPSVEKSLATYIEKNTTTKTPNLLVKEIEKKLFTSLTFKYTTETLGLIPNFSDKFLKNILLFFINEHFEFFQGKAGLKY